MFLLPWHPLFTFSPTHTHTGHRCAPTQDVRVPRNRAPNPRSTAASSLLYRYIVMICHRTNSPHLTWGMSWLRGEKGTPSRPHPTPKAQPPARRSLFLQQSISPPVSLPRFCFQSPMSPNTSDPFDKLKPGGPRRRALLPGHMTVKGSPLNCSPPLPETLVVRSSSGSAGCEGL